MKAAEHPDLKSLVARLERRRATKRMATTLMASLGLIGFGIMIVPVLGARPLPVPVATAPKPVAHTPNVFADAHVLGKAAIVYDLSNGSVIYQKNADEQLPLASLTKLLTTYAAVNALPGSAPVTISDSAIAQDGDSGLRVGETFAFRDLARFALVASSNDAAEAIAETAARQRSVSNQSLLASAASAAGLTQTYAVNGTGLDESATRSGGYGSAKDVAVLAGKLLSAAPNIVHATIEPSITVADSQGALHTLPNTNQDIVHMPSPLLSKTGYTDLAGGNLAVVFDAGINHPVAVVVLGSTRDGRFTDVDVLVDSTLRYFAGQ